MTKGARKQTGGDMVVIASRCRRSTYMQYSPEFVFKVQEKIRKKIAAKKAENERG